MVEIYYKENQDFKLIGNVADGSDIFYKDVPTKTMVLLGNIPPAGTPPKPTTVVVDAFGTNVIYPTKADGRIFQSPFNAGNNRTLGGGVREGDMITEGDARYIIDPSAGEMQFNGQFPRLYIYDAARAKMWENVEITCYYKMVTHTSNFQSGYQGFEISNRGQHELETKNMNVRTYYIRHSLNGTWWRIKEDVHPNSNDYAIKKNIPFDMNVWYGMKMIVITLPNGNVRLQSYRDTTDGKDGGTWTKMSDFTDTGSNWAGLPAYSPALPNCGCRSCLIRSDNVSDFRIKKLTIREIDGGAFGGSIG